MGGGIEPGLNQVEDKNGKNGRFWGIFGGSEMEKCVDWPVERGKIEPTW